VLTLYTWALRLLWPYGMLRLWLRGFRNRDYWQRIPERFGFVEPLTGPRVIWVHAVSVGEVRAAAPLVKKLCDRCPDHQILVTTMTPTGSATVASLFGDRVVTCYVPYDYPSAVRRFLDRIRPEVLIVMETELWPNIFHACNARNIPVAVTNVRMSESSMRRYLRIAPKLTRATLGQVRLLAVQSNADAERLLKLGADPSRLQVTGSIKFELALPASLGEAAEVLRRDWGADRPIWVAASTHGDEESRVLGIHRELKSKPAFSNALLVVVPRHPERFQPVVKICQRLNYKVALRSQHSGPLDPSVDVLLGDTMGELMLFYGACDVAFIGGSLVPTGGHNLLEAAALGKPVVFGPHMFNFAEIAQLTLERGAGVQVRDSHELLEEITAFLSDANKRDRAGEAGRKLVEENRGALQRTMKLLEPLLPVTTIIN
jgi:3-deoxy-D-manno-octulosonic-acid transferase